MKNMLFIVLVTLFNPNLYCTSGTEIPNACDSLLYACQEGHLEDAIALLQKGANVNCMSKIGNTPLSVACGRGHLRIVTELLNYGADVNIANTSGIAPIYRAASCGHSAIVKELLKVENINVNTFDCEGRTALFCASDAGYLDIVKELLKAKGINVNSLFYDGTTPLDVADSLEIKELLVQHGAIAFTPVIGKLSQFVDVLSKGEFEKLDSIISKNNSSLKNKLRQIVKNKFLYEFNPSPLYNNVSIMNPYKVKITGVVTAHGRRGFRLAGCTWEVGGITNYFILENENGNWLITDTDFAQKLGGANFWLIFILILVALAFWIWMMVDCFNRNFKNRGRWFIFLLLFNVIAAVVYFFRTRLHD